MYLKFWIISLKVWTKGRLLLIILQCFNIMIQSKDPVDNLWTMEIKLVLKAISHYCMNKLFKCVAFCLIWVTLHLLWNTENEPKKESNILMKDKIYISLPQRPTWLHQPPLSFINFYKPPPRERLANIKCRKSENNFLLLKK